MGNGFITQMRLSDHEQGESTPDKAGMEQSRNYLAAIAPHEYERSFKDRLPETIDGSAFIEQVTCSNVRVWWLLTASNVTLR